MDEIDIAQRHSEMIDKAAVDALRAGMPRGESAYECEDCGADIPEERRRAVSGCVCCIFCQTRRERKR